MSHNSRWQRAQKLLKKVEELREESALAGDDDLRDALKRVERAFAHPSFHDHATLNTVTSTSRGA